MNTNALIQVNSVQNDQELRALFSCDPELETLLLETGYSKPLARITTDDRSSITSSVTDYHCLTKVKAAMDQFVEGLGAGGLMKYIKSNPHEVKPMFCPVPSSLTAGY